MPNPSEPTVTTPSPSPPQDVIHDIGYRHYDGPRLGHAYIVSSLYLQSLRGAYGLGRSGRSKIMPLLLLVAMTAPAVVMVAVLNVGVLDDLPVPYPSYMVQLQLVVAIFVAGQAPQAVSRDLRFGTMPLYFSRPLRRHHYVFAKYAGLASAVLALLVTPLLVLYAGALLAKLPWWDQTRGLLQALSGAAVLSLVLAGLGLVIAAFTPRRGIGVAAVITVLLVLGAVQGIAQGLSMDQQRDDLATLSGLLAPVTAVDGLQSWVFGLDPATGVTPPDTVQGLAFLAAVVALAVGSLGVLLLRYRKVGP
jgi:ABC-2 type transport system permease protein